MGILMVETQDQGKGKGIGLPVLGILGALETSLWCFEWRSPTAPPLVFSGLDMSCLDLMFLVIHCNKKASWNGRGKTHWEPCCVSYKGRDKQKWPDFASSVSGHYPRISWWSRLGHSGIELSWNQHDWTKEYNYLSRIAGSTTMQVPCFFHLEGGARVLD